MMMLSQGQSIMLHISKVTQSLGDFYLQVQIYLINNSENKLTSIIRFYLRSDSPLALSQTLKKQMLSNEQISLIL